MNKRQRKKAQKKRYRWGRSWVEEIRLSSRLIDKALSLRNYCAMLPAFVGERTRSVPSEAYKVRPGDSTIGNFAESEARLFYVQLPLVPLEKADAGCVILETYVAPTLSPQTVLELRDELGCSWLDARTALELREGSKEFAKEYLVRSGLAAVMSDEDRYPKWTEDMMRRWSERKHHKSSRDDTAFPPPGQGTFFEKGNMKNLNVDELTGIVNRLKAETQKAGEAPAAVFGHPSNYRKIQEECLKYSASPTPFASLCGLKVFEHTSLPPETMLTASTDTLARFLLEELDRAQREGMHWSVAVERAKSRVLK